ncbi:16S rRNA (guanine(527)-N(7))-methyltransferase RsmG [Falsiroseomonas frigidaquae]|nr:16S rRNA (guanine(527)-N(7))-methyltransferase RsmG [Falsiroseomonas frigidaquae]
MIPHPLPDPMPLDDAIRARLDAYVELLLRWNTRINLVGRTTTDQVWQRHIEDSLQLVPLLPEGAGPIGDLGSGAGLPGLVLAIATGRPTHLVESDRRKAAFLNEAAARLDLAQVQIHATRIEEARLPPLAVLTARALAPLGTLLAYAHRLLAPGGIALFPKGRMAETELAEAQPAWSFTLDRFASRTDPEATIFRLSDIRHVQPQA